MPETRVCPECGELAEVRRYITVVGSGDADLDVWECECGWAEDVEDQ